MEQKQVVEAIRISDLINRLLCGELAANEQAELYAWVGASVDNQHFFFSILDEEGLTQLSTELRYFDVTVALAATKKRLETPIHKVSQKRFRIWHLSAAVVLFCVSIAAFFSLPDEGKEIYPGRSAATLILSNGKRLSLISVADGKLAEESGVSISKASDGTLVYRVISDEYTVSATQPHIPYNTLVTARGEQYQVILPDGTSVWLNAASSLKFPSTFANQSKREVELDGEAFFEVSPDPAHPFIVKTSKQAVEVLGTHFNISAYVDESMTKTTLLEGSVQVRLLHQETGKTLDPGQQSIVTKEGVRFIDDVDLEEITAWKNGYFKFNGNLQSIMAKISRWYDVEIVYQDVFGEDLALGGKITRDRDLSALLKIIENASGVQFKIKGRRVIVTK